MSATTGLTHSRLRAPRVSQVVFGLVVLGLLGVIAVQARSRTIAAKSAPVAPGMEDMQRRIRELEAEQERLQNLSSLLLKATREQATVRDEVKAKPSASNAEEAPPAPPQLTAHERYESLEANFANQSVDAAWSRPTEMQMQQVLGRFDQAKLMSLSCRTSMCRLEVQFPNREAREAYEVNHVAEAPFVNTNIWTQRFPQEDGSVRDVEMVSRSGALPSVD